MAKINLERYTEEGADFTTTASSTESAFGRLAMAEEKVSADIEKLEQTIKDADKMFADAERLDAEVSIMEAKLQADNISADESMALMRAADAVTLDYAGLDRASYTQESATLDPRSALMASKDDKRGFVTKMIDAAKKAITKMISGFRKIILKLSQVFDSTSESAKSLKEDLEKLGRDNSSLESQDFDSDESETIKDRHLAISVLGGSYATDATPKELYEALNGDSLVGMTVAAARNTKAEDDIDENPTSAIDDDLVKDKCKIASVGKTAARVLYVYTDDDVELPYFKSFTLSTDEKAGTVKTGSISDLTTICSSISSIMKDYGKTVDKEWKEVEKEEKEFDKVAKGMKSDPSDSAKKEYKAALAKYKATPKVAFYKAIDKAANAKAFLSTCQEAYDLLKKKANESSTGGTNGTNGGN